MKSLHNGWRRKMFAILFMFYEVLLAKDIGFYISEYTGCSFLSIVIFLAITEIFVIGISKTVSV